MALTRCRTKCCTRPPCLGQGAWGPLAQHNSAGTQISTPDPSVLEVRYSGDGIENHPQPPAALAPSDGLSNLPAAPEHSVLARAHGAPWCGGYDGDEQNAVPELSVMGRAHGGPGHGDDSADTQIATPVPSVLEVCYLGDGIENHPQSPAARVPSDDFSNISAAPELSVLARR